MYEDSNGNDDEEVNVGKEAKEDVETFGLDATTVELVEDLHHHKHVEKHGEVLTFVCWGVVIIEDRCSSIIFESPYPLSE